VFHDLRNIAEVELLTLVIKSTSDVLY